MPETAVQTERVKTTEREECTKSWMEVAQRMHIDIFKEHVMPHLAFRPTPLAKIMRESIKNAILEQWGCILGAIGIDDAMDFPQDWYGFPKYAIRELEDFMYNDEMGWRDVAHLEQPQALNKAIYNSILTNEWVTTNYDVYNGWSSDDEESEEDED